MHFASNLRAGRLLARGMCMGCCTPEAPEHEGFGRPPVPCIKGGLLHETKDRSWWNAVGQLLAAAAFKRTFLLREGFEAVTLAG